MGLLERWLLLGWKLLAPGTPEGMSPFKKPALSLSHVQATHSTVLKSGRLGTPGRTRTLTPEIRNLWYIPVVGCSVGSVGFEPTSDGL